MRKIFGAGETVLDIIFKNGAPQAAMPGGSVLNSAVSLGRTGLPVYFISEYGQDDVGNLVDDFLVKNGIDTTYVYRYKEANTSLAIAFLNEKNDAGYTFYKAKHEKRLDIEMPAVTNNDIIQFGSFFAILPDIRVRLLNFIHSARNCGALILYDPNFRNSHLADLDKLKPLIVENMQIAGIVRGSDEDFRNIFGAENAEQAWDVVSRYCKCLVYTANESGVNVKTESYSGFFPSDRITPVSTIGAGDNFNAGMLASIYRKNIHLKDLKLLREKDWSEIIMPAISFATHVCMSYENYISVEFARSFPSV